VRGEVTIGESVVTLQQRIGWDPLVDRIS